MADAPLLKRTTLELPRELWKALKIAAVETDRTASAIVTDAIRAYLARAGRQPA